MDWYLELNDTPFDAIKRGKKNRETRTKVPHNMTHYQEMKPGDRIIFTHRSDKEEMIVEILGVRHYKDVAEMFDAEGQDNCMSYDAPRDEAIASYDQLRGYTEGIKQYGIWAIEVKPVKFFTNQLVKEGYNKAAEEYVGKYRDMFKNNQHLDRLIDLIAKGATVLDIGCGAGVPIDKYLLDHGYKVIGIDISEKQIEIAKKNLPKGNFEVKDMSTLKEGEYQVDAVVSFYSIFHIPREQHQEVFKKINSFLSKGGLILVTMGVSDWEGVENDFCGTEMSWSHYGKDKNLEIIKEAGFEVVWTEVDISGEENHLIVLGRKSS